MDIEMIERVAKAIRERDTTDEFAMARAAIKAMREPTQKMEIAGCEANPTEWNDPTDEIFIADVTKKVYQAMIDAVLND